MKYMRMVAVFLALCLTFTCLPMTVHAGAGVIASGTCGENVTWTLGNNGELTISGTGDMENYSSYSGKYAPWYSYKDSIRTAVLENGVTNIGYSAFSGCTSLTRVEISDSVTSIGEEAFNGCSSLTHVEIPDSVISIDFWAFYFCTNLTSIGLPDSVTSIGDEAFAGCKSLTSIEIPDSVTSISWGMFAGCRSLTRVGIPNSVTSIGSTAFASCSSLTSIEIPDGVTYIGLSTFADCSSLTSIRIPESVTGIGISAFARCSSLTSVVIPERVTSIAAEAFYDCTSLDSITFLGDAPIFGSYSNGLVFDAVFCNVTATAYYPTGNDTWTEEVMQDHGGHIAWVPVCLDSHSLVEWYTVTEATCFQQGEERRDCANCEYYETRVVEAAGHSYVDNVTASTCEEGGCTTHVCSACGDSYVDDYTDALGHNYVGGVCLNCGDRNVIPGDLNGDGEVDIFDANLVVGYYNGTVDLTAEQLAAADVNGDGEVDIFDANLIVSFYNGTIAAFPAEN